MHTKHRNLGVILTPRMSNVIPYEHTIWAVDTGCFLHPESFSLQKYLDWLRMRQQWQPTCLFATAPDVVRDAQATWERSKEVLPQLRELGYAAALVAQDGIEHMAIDWNAFDVLFVGGSTQWKLSEIAYDLIAEAVNQRKWIHIGRVNSLRRLRAMRLGGAHSADGTKIKFGPDVNLPLVVQWLDSLERQPDLWSVS